MTMSALCDDELKAAKKSPQVFPTALIRFAGLSLSMAGMETSLCKPESFPSMLHTSRGSDKLPSAREPGNWQGSESEELSFVAGLLSGGVPAARVVCAGLHRPQRGRQAGVRQHKKTQETASQHRRVDREMHAEHRILFQRLHEIAEWFQCRSSGKGHVPKQETPE